jgi:DNA-binding NarL/FixJ family response regulator
MRLLLATAQPDLRLSLELFLSEQPGVEVVGSASESDGLLALIHTTEPDMILTDWDLLGPSLSNVIAEIHHLQHPPTTIVLVTHNSDYQTAVNAGADAVVLKGSSPDLLLSAFQKLRPQFTSRQETNRYE